MTLTENGFPIHIAQAQLRDAAGSDANWHMRGMGIPGHVASEMDRVVGQAYQSILGVGDLTVAQAKQLFIPMRDGGFGLSSAELQSEPATMATWASCAARVTARVGLGCVVDLSAEVHGLRSALSKLQAIKREAGDDPNDPDKTRFHRHLTTRPRTLPCQQKPPRTCEITLEPTANTGSPLIAPADQAPPDSSSSQSPTPRWFTTPLSSKLPECDCADPFGTRGGAMQKQETRRNRMRSRTGQGRQTRYDLPVRTCPLRQA